MYKDFTKYAWPGNTWPVWGALSAAHPEYTLIPDAILEAFHTGLRSVALPPMDFAALQETQRRLLKPGQWTDSQALAFGQHVMGLYDPKYAHVIEAQMRERPQRLQTVRDRRSGGWCSINGVSMYTNGDIGNPLYLTHELGHFVEMFGLTPEQPHYNHAGKAVCEFQAFMPQLAAYDVMLQANDDLAQQARLHRAAETIGLYFNVVEAYPAHAYLQGKTRQEAAAQLLADGWQMSPKEAKSLTNFVYEWAEKDERFARNKTMFGFHHHGFAGLMSLVMHDRFRRFVPEQKQQALHVLYGRGENTYLKDVLDVFGLRTLKDFENAGTFAVNHIRQDLRTMQSNVLACSSAVLKL